MSASRRLLSSFRRDRRGNVAIMTALASVVLVGASAMGVDIMSFYRQKRLLQTATDLATIAAAADPANAQAAATATLSSNGLPVTITSLVRGTYIADSTMTAASRFTPGGSSPNAVRLYTQTRAPIYLGTIFNMSGGSRQTSAAIGANAVAMRSAVASFGVGSRLAALNAGALNALLSAATGSSINLTLADYNSLAAANINFFSYSQSLASQAHLSAVDYNSVLNASVTPSAALNALSQQASGLTSAASNLLSQLASRLPSTPIQTGGLASVGPYGGTALGSLPSMQLPVRVLDLLTGIVGLASNGQQVSANLATNVPGLTAQLSLSVGSPAQSVQAAAPPATASTSQIRFQVTFGVTIPGLGTAVVPIAIEAARATAQLASIDCPVGNNADATATLNVTPSLINAGIGTLSTLDTSLATSVTQPTQILSVVGLVGATAASTISSASQTYPLTFTMADASAGTIKTVGNNAFAGAIASSLINNMQLNIQVLGINLGLGPTVRLALTAALTAVSPTMDSILAGLLNSLGVQLGQADSWVSSIKCGGAVLVN